MKYGFGIDLGGTTIKLAFFDREGNLLHKWEIPTDTSENGRNILPDIAGAVLGYLEERGVSREEVLGIGIGVPGPVDDCGTLNRCVNLGWGVFNIEEALETLTGFPVKAGNDANVAALGEYWKGGGKGYENMVLLTLGTGVGGGIILDGRILYGAHGAAGEIGHMVLEPRETELCTCGKRGCAEQYCSATGIVRVAKKYLGERQDASALRDMEDFSCKDVFDAAGAGDAPAKEILETVYCYIGRLIADICAVVNPQAVVIGGGVSRAGEPLVAGVRRQFDKFAFHAVRGAAFTLATLGNDAGAYGAFKLALQAFEK